MASVDHPIEIIPVSAKDFPLEALSELLSDCVNQGASIGFLAPCERSVSMSYWNALKHSLNDDLLLWVASTQGRVVGTIQLSCCTKANGLHRADVQKLMVSTASRGKGIAQQLLARLESAAQQKGIRLLVLDTETGSKAEALYARWGWQRAGQIPDFAASPFGELRPTTLYYKHLPG
ncbi:GNAT family N-acetyltransferase [Pokkaliibacter sp. CJK22405]|uniref:GNAT family N-acetyltransferase n=1 Tax=Pokkaliibacter sp. CJK22405 TaxID=3384615 RepID=UPI003984F843